MGNFPEDLRYTKEHEWVKIDGDIAIVGITSYAQGELGDIVFVDVDTVGDTLDADTVFGSIEAVKTVSDLYLPISGEIVELNPNLKDNPELVNKDPYGDGWMVKVKANNIADVEGLMDAAAYQELVGA